MQDSISTFPKYCNHTASNWVIWSIFIIFFILLFIEIIWSKQLHDFCKKKFSGVSKKPILVISVSVLVLIILSYFLEKNGIGLFVNSNILSILSIVGILGTIIGVILTYEQLKIAEDRIDGYIKLYSELKKLMSEKNIKKFQFYGPTIIPGHIAYGDRNDIKEYKKLIYDLVDELKKKFEIIVPSDELYIEAYSHYADQFINNIHYPQSKITKLLEEANELQKTILDNEGDLTQEKSKIEIIDNFYFSNGITVIYAIPLHFQVAIAGSESSVSSQTTKKSDGNSNKNSMHPELIGFKTTNRSIVKAFELNFTKLNNKINEE
jgi:hypothetical protein